LQGLFLGAVCGAALMFLIGLVFAFAMRRYKNLYKSKMVPGEVFSKSKRVDGDVKGYIHLGMWGVCVCVCVVFLLGQFVRERESYVPFITWFILFYATHHTQLLLFFPGSQSLDSFSELSDAYRSFSGSQSLSGSSYNSRSLLSGFNERGFWGKNDSDSPSDE
jgi:hypothetical protein